MFNMISNDKRVPYIQVFRSVGRIELNKLMYVHGTTKNCVRVPVRANSQLAICPSVARNGNLEKCAQPQTRVDGQDPTLV
jgi:hypothetical protein